MNPLWVKILSCLNQRNFNLNFIQNKKISGSLSQPFSHNFQKWTEPVLKNTLRFYKAQKKELFISSLAETVAVIHFLNVLCLPTATIKFD